MKKNFKMNDELNETIEIDEIAEFGEFDEAAGLDEPAKFNEFDEASEADEPAEFNELDEASEVDEPAEFNELDETSEPDVNAYFDEFDEASESAATKKFSAIAEFDENIGEDTDDEKFFEETEKEDRNVRLGSCEQMYRNEIRSISKLTKEEEESLGWKIHKAKSALQLLNEFEQKSGGKRISKQMESQLRQTVKEGKEARDKLVSANLRLVAKVAGKYKNCGIEYMDLVEWGNLGLLRGAVKFDVTKGYRFSTYGMFWINQGILRALDEHSKIIRHPARINAIMTKLRRTVNEFHVSLGTDIDMNELSEEEIQLISDRADMKVDEIKRAISLHTLNVGSLDSPLGEDGEELMVDQVADCNAFCEELYVQDTASKELVSKLWGHFNEREIRIIMQKFGFYDGEEHTFDQIAELEGLSRQRVQQITNNALDRIRKIPSLYREIEEFFNAKEY